MVHKHEFYSLTTLMAAALLCCCYVSHLSSPLVHQAYNSFQKTFFSVTHCLQFELSKLGVPNGSKIPKI